MDMLLLHKMHTHSVGNRHYYFAPFAAHSSWQKGTNDKLSLYTEAFYPSTPTPIKYCPNGKNGLCEIMDHPLKHFIDEIIDKAPVESVAAATDVSPLYIAAKIDVSSNANALSKSTKVLKSVLDSILLMPFLS
jgi:hypothetical protein